jgi:glutathione-specific gamma-glutamylcyclotransferase
MLTGAYAPRWMRVASAEGPLHALAFCVNRTHTRYAGRLPEEQIIACIAEANGPLGTCATYLFNTVQHLEELGIKDARLVRLRNEVAAKIRTAAAD